MKENQKKIKRKLRSSGCPHISPHISLGLEAAAQSGNLGGIAGILTPGFGGLFGGGGAGSPGGGVYGGGSWGEDSMIYSVQPAAPPAKAPAKRKSFVSTLLGIRQHGQSFKGCMAQHADQYSLGGFASGAYYLALKQPPPTWLDAGLQFTYGNAINTLLFGSFGSAAATGVGEAPTLVGESMGTVTTFGRRTSDLMSLNLAGKGGLPQALSQASQGAKSVLGTLSTALGGGLKFTQQLTLGLGFAAGEALNCSVEQ